MDSTCTYYNPYTGVINCTVLNTKIVFALRNSYPGIDVAVHGDTAFRIFGSGILPLNVSLAEDSTNAGEWREQRSALCFRILG